VTMARVSFTPAVVTSTCRMPQIHTQHRVRV
jgi:hypothetical protein